MRHKNNYGGICEGNGKARGNVAQVILDVFFAGCFRGRDVWTGYRVEGWAEDGRQMTEVGGRKMDVG